MAAFFKTLTPVDIIFLVTALMSALDFLIWTFWLAVKGGIDAAPAPLNFEEKPSNRMSKIFRAVLGFMMMFGVAGLALRQLLGADPLWALLGAVGAGVLLVGVIVSVDREIQEVK